MNMIKKLLKLKSKKRTTMREREAQRDARIDAFATRIVVLESEIASQKIIVTQLENRVNTLSRKTQDSFTAMNKLVQDLKTNQHNSNAHLGTIERRLGGVTGKRYNAGTGRIEAIDPQDLLDVLESSQ